MTMTRWLLGVLAWALAPAAMAGGATPLAEWVAVESWALLAVAAMTLLLGLLIVRRKLDP